MIDNESFEYIPIKIRDVLFYVFTIAAMFFGFYFIFDNRVILGMLCFGLMLIQMLFYSRWG